MGVLNYFVSDQVIHHSPLTTNMSVPWETINEKLPFQRKKEAYEKRKSLWTQFDVNGNGFLSLAEVTKGIRDVIAVDELFDAIPAINRSFHHVKNVSKTPNEHGPDFIEFREFRLFLQTLRQYFEYYQAFDRLDSGDDRRVDKEEFTSENMKSTLEKVSECCYTPLIEESSIWLLSEALQYNTISLTMTSNVFSTVYLYFSIVGWTD